MHQQLVDFIEEYLRKGSTKEEIHSALLRVGGWTQKEVDDVFLIVERNNSSLPQDVPVKPIPTIPAVSSNIDIKPTVPTNSPVTPQKPIIPPYSRPVINKPPMIGFQTSSPSSAPKPQLEFKTTPALPPRPLMDIKEPSSQFKPVKPQMQIYPMPTQSPVSANNTLRIVLITISIFSLFIAGGVFVYFYYFAPVINEKIPVQNIATTTETERNVILPPDNAVPEGADLLILPPEIIQDIKNDVSSTTLEVPIVPPTQSSSSVPFVND
ncbi:MAG: hypothetical protein UT05_C0002G0026 [Parcubacteria group bacterium GW2011_GWF2_38_76]|nr:MAG: hypothetical protein UT05_C0002G0026 [Parcubacteria group bacterium GW2011_GWF2_38_76]HBM45816.1 hypothetical protein [Patescibacteria group bacterium]